MKINQLTPNEAILKELSQRLRRIRKQRGYSQDELAAEAGLGIATLRRIEGAKDAQLGSWLKVLKALEMSASIDSLLPETLPSPMENALAAKRGKRGKKANKGGVWGDESS